LIFTTPNCSDTYGRGVAKEAAEDLIQKAFIYIWENRTSIDEDKSLRAYLFKIAYSRMLNLF
jgi:RNA polymerase sigma-70 factor (ECF subfamily)